MVVGYDPSHKNVNSEVRTPYKILSTLLRMIDNESKAEKKRKNTPQKKSSSMNTYKFGGYQDEEDERLDTIGGDDDEDDYNLDDAYGEEDEENNEDNKIAVDLDDLPNEDNDFEEEKIELSKMISKDRGLADLETGSEVYMSEMLGFEIEDAEEMEEQNEEDLLALGDTFADINLKDFAIEKLKHIQKTLNKLVSQLPEKDKKLYQTYILN